MHFAAANGRPNWRRLGLFPTRPRMVVGRGRSVGVLDAVDFAPRWIIGAAAEYCRSYRPNSTIWDRRWLAHEFQFGRDGELPEPLSQAVESLTHARSRSSRAVSTDDHPRL